MILHAILIAGFGGQGVLTLGQILAYAALAEGYHVSWLPSYGPEQRGGTANCAVVISDRPISSPLVTEPTAAVVLNRPSVEKFAGRVRPGGVLVVNSSLVPGPVARTDIRVIPVSATQSAAALGDARVANMVALGALLAATRVVKPGAVLGALAKVLGPDKSHLVALNRAALEQGMALAPAGVGC